MKKLKTIFEKVSNSIIKKSKNNEVEKPKPPKKVQEFSAATLQQYRRMNSGQ